MAPAQGASPWLVAALAAAAAGLGCLSTDDRMLELTPDPIALDDFEEMTAQPKDPRFGAWQYAAYNTDASTGNGMLATPGHNSNWCLSLDWQLSDPPNGTLDHPGVLQRSAIPGSIDLSRHTRIVFTHLYQNMGSGPPLKNVLVRLLCQELGSAYEKALPIAFAWEINALPLAEFGEVASLGPGGIAREDCLRVVDEIQFRAQPDIQDGASSSGAILIDDVSIR